MHRVDKEERLSPGQGEDRSRSAAPENVRATDKRALYALLEELLAMHRQLAQGVMPRAARITGTSQQWAQTVARLEVAIRMTKTLIANGEGPVGEAPHRGPLGAAPQCSVTRLP